MASNPLSEVCACPCEASRIAVSGDAARWCSGSFADVFVHDRTTGESVLLRIDTPNSGAVNRPARTAVQSRHDVSTVLVDRPRLRAEPRATSPERRHTIAL